jgi:hypothetical protein
MIFAVFATWWSKLAGQKITSFIKNRFFSGPQPPPSSPLEPPPTPPTSPPCPNEDGRIDSLEKRVSRIEEVFEQSAGTLERILEKLDHMSTRIDEFSEDKRLRKEHELFVDELDKIGELFVTQMQLSPPIKTMVMSGCGNGGRVLGDTLRSGLHDFNVGVFREKVLDVLRAIRASYGGSIPAIGDKTPDVFLRQLRDILHIKLTEFIVNLELAYNKYKMGYSNYEDWKSVYKVESAGFIKSFIAHSVSLYRVYTNT